MAYRSPSETTAPLLRTEAIREPRTNLPRNVKRAYEPAS